MSKITKTFIGLSVAVMVLAGVAVMPAQAATLTQAQINAIISLLQSFGADTATVSSVQSALTGTPTTPTTPTTTTGYTFAVDLKMGSTGTDVSNLQTVLKTDSAIYPEGLVTGTFGALTKAAVIKFQNKYASEVLTPVGLTAGTGYVGSLTRAKLNALYGGAITTTPTTTTTTVVAAGTGLTISSATQPAASLAVEGAARLPFTKVSFTAGSDGDVTITGVNIERTGLASDAVFSGIALLDENNQQLGLAKTLNSEHKATIGDSFTVKAGQSRTMTIAGNMFGTPGGSSSTDSLDAYAGQVAYISVTGVNTTATVTGVLPITGAGHTINASLAIGSVTNNVTNGLVDPTGNQTKNIGVTGYTFSSAKFWAGSTEKIRIKSIRWNQSGSAATADLANIKTYVDATAYDAVVSSDGKYYTSTFGTGIVVDKGASVEISVKGDIVGGSGRTISFDLYKTTDIYITGETYGYGITPPTSGTGFAATNPWYNAAVVSVSNGTLSVSVSTAVPAQNIAINLSSQPLGAFDVEVKGEPISVASMLFRLSAWAGTGSASTQDITSITMVDNETGAIVAGPKDIAASAPTVTFTDTVTFPVGKKAYVLKGKLGTDYASNQTIAASTTPSTDWTSMTGQTTGNSITASPASAITANTMTVKAASTAITLSGSPASQTVVAGTQNFTLANIQLDATASGEDVKFNTMPLYYSHSGATHLTGCQLFDGSTALNSGSNVPTLTASTTVTVTTDSGLTVPKGTIKTIAMKCNISANATTSSYYQWGIQAASAWSATGVSSSQSASLSGSANYGQTMTAGTASFTVAKDSSSPAYSIVAAGTSGVTLGVLKFSATNDAITLNRVALQLTNTSTSSATDLTKVYLYDGATKVGESMFTGTATTTAVTVSGVTIPKDGSKVLTIKGDVASLDTNNASTLEGAVIAVDYDGTGQAGSTYGTTSSGASVTSGTATDTSVAGFRVFKSYPTFARISVPSSTLVAGTMDLYRFSVTASPSTGNGIGVQTFNVNIATSTGSAANGTTTITNLDIYAYTDSAFSSPISGFANGLVYNGSGGLLSADDNIATTSAIVQIPAGSTYYFAVKGTVTGTAGTTNWSGSVTTKISGDTAYPALTTRMGNVDSVSTSKLIWSPIATSTNLVVGDIDWTNGYGVSGLPSTGMDVTTISK